MTSHDGPHAATRHVKDRRPAYNTEAATATTAPERRSSALEGRQQTSPRSQGQSKSDAAAQIDSTHRDFSRRFDIHDERLASLEGTVELLWATEARVEKRLRPYEEYQTQALDAVKQLQELQSRLQRPTPEKASPEKPSSTVSALSTSVNEHEASIRQYSSRLLQLEDDMGLAKAQSMSTQDLALALISRIQRGDILKESTVVALRLALGSEDATSSARNPSIPRQQETPVTDDAEPLQPPIERSIEAPINLPRPSIKRKRPEPPPTAPPTVQRVRFDSADLGTPEVQGALDSFLSGNLRGDDQEPEEESPVVAPAVEGDGVDREAVSTPPETRRASRRARTSTTQPGFTHWREANKIVKGLRSSGSSPRKGGA
ncbi:hypothetical protein B0A55_07692 [Friedmanniomyces simplex]|uniref:Uncharacterized protein n=1 Tax=Friedmanniomyces simplex TaxID=329884 RepID=A0A4U0X7G8_9PEZI|nr:hypothetical protein B0A55_07692 [Friedmanniomyces simplex]